MFKGRNNVYKELLYNRHDPVLRRLPRKVFYRALGLKRWGIGASSGLLIGGWPGAVVGGGVGAAGGY